MNNSIERSSFDPTHFTEYLTGIIHQWLKTLTALAYTLIPTFFILDFFTMPQELLPRFGVYRLVSTLIILIQYFLIRNTKPGKHSYYHGYLVTINAIEMLDSGSGAYGGDIANPNCDGVVDITDMLPLKSAGIGCVAGQPCYEPAADFNMDGKISMTDMLILKDNFGRVLKEGGKNATIDGAVLCAPDM